jgi:hypothetical protein
LDAAIETLVEKVQFDPLQVNNLAQLVLESLNVRIFFNMFTNIKLASTVIQRCRNFGM